MYSNALSHGVLSGTVKTSTTESTTTTITKAIHAMLLRMKASCWRRVGRYAAWRRASSSHFSRSSNDVLMCDLGRWWWR